MTNNAKIPSAIEAPTTQEDANSPLGWRILVIVGGAVALIPLHPVLYAWATLGCIIVPLTWVLTARQHKKMMAAAGCTTRQEWKAFVSQLPTKKQLLKSQPPSPQPIAKASRPDQLSKRKKSARFVSPARPELHYPHYRLLTVSNYANYEIVGEDYRESSVIAALGGLEPNIEKTLDDVLTFLIPEPENPYGHGNAVMVWMNGHHIGYLSNDDAERFCPVLNDIISAGYLPVTSGRLWGVSRYTYERKLRHHLYARVALNEPEQLVPTNDPPVGAYSLLPWGSAIQVTKEADHLAELTNHLHGPDSYAIATLRPAIRKLKNGTEREYVTVHLDGDEIGELTPTMSERVLPTIRHLLDLELKAAAWARVKGSALAIEVTLHAAKAHEIPDSWLSEIPVTIPPLRTQSQFVAGEEIVLDATATSNDQSAEAYSIVRQREQDWDF